MPHAARTLAAPYWQRQDGEPAKSFSRFEVYLEQPRGARSYAWVAERCGVRRQTVQEQAQTWRWAERAAAYDSEVSRQLRQRALAAAEEELHNQIAASAELLAGARRAVATTDPSAAEAARWAETASKLLGHALNRLDGTGDTLGENTAKTLEPRFDDIPEFQGLTPAEQQDRLDQIVGSLARLAAYEEREQRQELRGPRQGSPGATMG